MNRTQISAISRISETIGDMLATIDDIYDSEVRRRENNYNSSEIKSKATANIQSLDTAYNELITVCKSLRFIIENECEVITDEKNP